MKKLLYVIGFLFGVFAKALTVMLFWNWFIVPLGVVSIGFFVAMGIGILGSVLTFDSDSIQERGDDLLLKLYVMPLAMLLICGFGWLISFFV